MTARGTAAPRADTAGVLPVIGVVLIGRNEGERLRRALESIQGRFAAAVYVDSDSTDGSSALARSLGADVVQLDLRRPFTAARARNEGFERLAATHPAIAHVQFIDGDCELDPGWLARGLAELDADPVLAVVCGRRRERAPDASVYNLLCDLEWDTPVGRDTDCGGDALIRASAFRAAGGYDARLISGEEADLCARLREKGFGVARIDAEMTRHDAAMTRAGQWWQRAVRTGVAAAEGAIRRGPTRRGRHARHAASALFWAVAVPAGAVGIALAPGALVPLPAKLVLVALAALAYVVLFARVVSRGRARGRDARASRIYALSCILAKWPEVQGISGSVARRLLRREARWIEYKDVPASRTGATSAPGGGTTEPRRT